MPPLLLPRPHPPDLAPPFLERAAFGEGAAAPPQRRPILRLREDPPELRGEPWNVTGGDEPSSVGADHDARRARFGCEDGKSVRKGVQPRLAVSLGQGGLDTEVGGGKGRAQRGSVELAGKMDARRQAELLDAL